MNLLPDSNWLGALKLPTQVMSGVFIACLVLLAIDQSEMLKLEQFGQLTRPLVIVALVISGALSLTGIIAFLKDTILDGRKHSLLTSRRKLRAEENEEKRAKAEQAVLERLDHLSTQEVRYLASCLRDGSQSFYTYVHSPAVTTLRGKGLVYTPGGTHHQDHYPFTVYDFVWKALLARKNEIIEKDEKNKRKEEEQKRERFRR